MLVQYEDQNRPPPLTSTWSWQDTRGSRLLIILAWIGLVIGVAGAFYWAHLSVLGALFGTVQWPGYVWLALTAAGAALIAPVLWPFFEDRRPEIGKLILAVGIICWIVTSASGALYLIARAERGQDSLATAPMAAIEAALKKDLGFVSAARQDCDNGVWRGCDWLNSWDGRATRTRIEQYEDERARRSQEPAQKMTPIPIRIIITARQRFLLFATVGLGGAIALAMIWGPAEALKAMYSEPGTLLPRIGLPAADGLPVGDGGALANPIEMAFESWARQCLERARGERVMLATMHAHYRGWCIQRGHPTMGDEAFGRALNRPRDPMIATDLGGPMIRFGAFPHKTGGRMEYIGVRILPDGILDDIQGGGDV